jgi:hypothetical protein
MANSWSANLKDQCSGTKKKAKTVTLAKAEKMAGPRLREKEITTTISRYSISRQIKFRLENKTLATAVQAPLRQSPGDSP